MWGQPPSAVWASGARQLSRRPIGHGYRSCHPANARRRQLLLLGWAVSGVTAPRTTRAAPRSRNAKSQFCSRIKCDRNDGSNHDTRHPMQNTGWRTFFISGALGDAPAPVSYLTTFSISARSWSYGTAPGWYQATLPARSSSTKVGVVEAPYTSKLCVLMGTGISSNPL